VLRELHRHPCHGFLTHLTACYAGEAEAALLCGGAMLRHLRVLDVRGPCGFAVARAAQRTLRCASISRLEGDVDFTGFTALRALTVRESPRLTEARLPPQLARLGAASFGLTPQLRRVDLSGTAVTRLPDGFMRDRHRCGGVAILLPPALTAVGPQCCVASAVAAFDLAGTAVTDIGDGFLKLCMDVAAVRFPPSLRRLGDDALYKCSKLAAHDGLARCALEAVGNNFAVGNAALTAAALPPTLQSLGYYAYRDCGALTAVDVSATQLAVLEAGFCLLCTRLTAVAPLPPTLRSIASSCFDSCAALTALDLSRTRVTEIGSFLLDGCTALTEVRFPATLTALGDSVLADCLSLPSVDLSHTALVTVGGDFLGGRCDRLTAVFMPASVTSVGVRAHSAVHLALERVGAVYNSQETSADDRA
jgi:hypothetical protein